MQLNRFLALSGLCSRRKAVELIASGAVKINGTIIKNPAHRVATGDRVVCHGKIVTPQEFSYILLNKPLGYITTCSDELHRSTVLDLCKKAGQGARIFPVGRLDIDSRGLLLLTNDGELAQRLSHPSFEIEKRYRVTLHKPISMEFEQLLREGILIDGERIMIDALDISERNRAKCEIVLHSGRNRIIRRLMSVGGYMVKDLYRIGFAGLTSYGLASGEWRYLTAREKQKLLKI